LLQFKLAPMTRNRPNVDFCGYRQQAQVL
jgi:hypothetical protein